MAKPSSLKAIPITLQTLSGEPDQAHVFNSNSPELIQTPGVLLSTLPKNVSELGLEHAFQGDFGLFFHHIVKQPIFSKKSISVGLIAHNLGENTAQVKVTQGVSYLTRPDAPFLNLKSVIEIKTPDSFFAGPGSRVSMDWIQGRSNLPLKEKSILKGQSKLLFKGRIPTNPFWFLQQLNARTALMSLKSNHPIHLSLVALAHEHFKEPTLENFLYELDQAKPAGPKEQNATHYDPKKPSQGGVFRYGRVSGVSQGLKWNALPINLAQLSQGKSLALPISTVYLKRFGTHQNQSALLLARKENSAVQAHGNYGMSYHIPFKGLPNQSYQIGFAHPEKILTDSDRSQATMYIRQDPGHQVRFRGGLKIRQKGKQDRLYHLILREGEFLQSIQDIDCNGQEECEFELILNYPADATPPQILLIKTA